VLLVRPYPRPRYRTIAMLSRLWSSCATSKEKFTCTRLTTYLLPTCLIRRQCHTRADIFELQCCLSSWTLFPLKLRYFHTNGVQTMEGEALHSVRISPHPAVQASHMSRVCLLDYSCTVQVCAQSPSTQTRAGVRPRVLHEWVRFAWPDQSSPRERVSFDDTCLSLSLLP
jgi:hypothetical protein